MHVEEWNETKWEQHLGRAKDLGEFVKHGCQEASIEIELAKDPTRFKKNPVICRTIKREGNKSTFTINGRPSTKQHVLSLAQSFFIQIDNLCQFLPQDKVAEFAALSPVELLHSTQRAAGTPDLVGYHEDLKRLRAEQKKVQAENQSESELLENLEKRQQMQKADVERMQQRKRVQEEIQMLEKYRPVPAYREARKTTSEAKNRRTQAQREAQKMREEAGPALRAVNEKETYKARVSKVVKDRALAAKLGESDADALFKASAEKDAALQDLQKEKEAEKQGRTQRQAERKRVEAKIRDMDRQIENPPPEFDATHYNHIIVR